MFGAIVPPTATLLVYGVITLTGVSMAAGHGCPTNPHTLQLAQPHFWQHLMYGVGPYACIDGLPDMRLGLADMIVLVQGGLMCLSAVCVATSFAWHVLTPLISDRSMRTQTRVLLLWGASTLVFVMLQAGNNWFSGYMGYMGDSMCPPLPDGGPFLCTASRYVREVTKDTLSLLGAVGCAMLAFMWTITYSIMATLFFSAKHIVERSKRHTST